MSVICRTFVQNTWRSDLCSNCFKSLDDHADGGSHKRHSVCDKLSMPRYVPQAPSLYQSRGISTSLKWRLNESLYDRVARRDFASQTITNCKTNGQDHLETAGMKDEQNNRNRGILIKNSSVEKKFRSRGSVDFADEEAMVIGYGGNDYDSDTSPWEMGSDDGSIDLDLLDDTDEDRKISRLTKNNTEFNSFNKNLLTSDNSTRKIKAEEEKLNSINNNNNSNNNSGKPTDKSISILTYNDIQSTKKEKKLNQYFFPSPTEALKSYLNRRGNSMVIDDSVIKNNNELCQKIHNSQREVEKRGNSNVVLKDDFSPLNTQTYSFVSELSKNVSGLDQSSDSDYSTCRHTTSDSTDSESFHDVEETKAELKKSFLHGTYTNASRLNDLDVEKKYDAGSSTSGDISNFSDDSDTHDSSDGAVYKRRNDAASTTPRNKVQITEQSETHTDLGEPDDKSGAAQAAVVVERSPQSAKHIVPIPAAVEDKRNKSQNECNVDHNMTLSSKCNALSGSSPDLISSTNANEKTRTSPKPNKVPESNNKAPVCTENKPVGRKSPESEAKPPESNASSVSTSSSALHVPTEDRSEIFNEVANEQDSENNSVSDESQRTLHEKEFGYDEDNSDNDRSPEAINNRQSKLAALALELELARKDSERKSEKHPAPCQATTTPPEPRMRHSLPNLPCPPNSSCYPTIKKASAISCVNRLSTLPDVLQETPAKQKKSRFSLKKLLKRNKDSGTFSPANKEVNPKAWKKQTFDRNRLSLEIVHPMDLTTDVPTSADSTPTEEHRQIVSTHPGRSMFKGVSSRARSLSALPQLSGDEHSGVALIECRKMDTVPARKAGTVAERKKIRPSLVRTPSCSALPNRTTPAALHGSDRAPPPKPPPPPKCKAMHPPPPPPPPHSHPRCSKTSTNSPARPPPPKVPDTKSRNHSSSSSSQELREQNNSNKEYANLGDIRSLLTPKKPQRPSAFSGSSRDGEMEKKEDLYETLPPTQEEEEEDHYTYLDETEVKSYKATRTKMTEFTAASKASIESIPFVRPWLDLQTSYAAIAAANYESLAELITASQNEGAQHFKKLESSLKWKDFLLEAQQPCHIRDRAIYNAACKSETQDQVTLVVAPKKYITPQNVRNQTRFPVLASFIDHVPKSSVSTDNYVFQDSETAAIYVLQRSVASTVKDFAKVSSMDDSNQSIHLRNYCFVLLQLIHTLKSLQAEGIEEINYDLEILVLVVTDEDKPPVLVLFPEDKVQLTLGDFTVSRKTLCQATLETMLHFLQIHEIDDLKECFVNGELLAEPVAHTFKAIAKVLAEEKASSLSQAKGFLEYMLWGPVDVTVSQSDAEEVLDTILQRWLDLQRAQMVKSTISHLQNKKISNTIFHVYEEYQLVFLLQASVKSLKGVISKL